MRVAEQRRPPARLVLVRAKGLAVADWDNGLSDPYVIATVLDAKNRQVWRHTSKTVHDSLDPAPQANVCYCASGSGPAAATHLPALSAQSVRSARSGPRGREKEKRIRGRLSGEGQPA